MKVEIMFDSKHGKKSKPDPNIALKLAHFVAMGGYRGAEGKMLKKIIAHHDECRREKAYALTISVQQDKGDV